MARAERSSSHEEKRAETVFEGGKGFAPLSREDTDPPLPHLASPISSLPALYVKEERLLCFVADSERGGEEEEGPSPPHFRERVSVS